MRASRACAGQTNETGYISMTFEDLQDGIAYNVFMTIGNILPYQPVHLYNDTEVLLLQVQLPVNISNAD